MAEIASNHNPTLWEIFHFSAAYFCGAAVGVSASTTTPHVAGMQVLGRQVRTRHLRTRQVLGLQVTGSQILGAQVATGAGAHVEQVLTAAQA